MEICTFGRGILRTGVREAFPFVKWGRVRLDNDGIHSTHTLERAEGMAQGERESRRI